MLRHMGTCAEVGSVRGAHQLPSGHCQAGQCGHTACKPALCSGSGTAVGLRAAVLSEMLSAVSGLSRNSHSSPLTGHWALLLSIALEDPPPLPQACVPWGPSALGLGGISLPVALPHPCLCFTWPECLLSPALLNPSLLQGLPHAPRP